MKRETVVTANRHVSGCFMFVVQNVLDNKKTATVIGRQLELQGDRPVTLLAPPQFAMHSRRHNITLCDASILEN